MTVEDKHQAQIGTKLDPIYTNLYEPTKNKSNRAGSTGQGADDEPWERIND